MLRVKRCFLSLHVLNQFADALGQQWIAHPRGKLSVVLNLLVEFFALVAHGQPLKGDQPEESRFVQSAMQAAVGPATIAKD